MAILIQSMGPPMIRPHALSTSYAAMAQEDRCAPRHLLQISARLRTSGQRPMPVTITNLSIAGFGCSATMSAHAGDLCWLTLPGLESQAAQIVWNDGATIGGAFMQLLNPLVLEALIARLTR